MSTKKITGMVLILIGTVVFIAGICQYQKSRTPNTCIVSFSKSLGGKASLELNKKMQQVKYCGIAGITVGVVVTLAGGVLLLSSGKKRF